MTIQDEKLIQELLYNVQVSGNRPMERRLADLTLWFYKNKKDIPLDNLASKAAFLEKTIWILLEVLALQAERLHEMENRGRSSNLYLPKGVRVEGDVKKYG